MDLISYILGLHNSGEKLARIETKAFTYDGILEGKDKLPAGSDYAVRVGVAIDPKTITKISGMMGGQITEVFAEDISVTETDSVFVVEANGLQLVAIVKERELGITGTYVIHASIGYVTSVEYEVVHPLPDWAIPEIPASKLPGAVLPVVELSTTVASGATFTEKESALLSDAIDSQTPPVVRATMQTSTTLYENVVAVGSFSKIGGVNHIIFALGNNSVVLRESNGAWSVVSIP